MPPPTQTAPKSAPAPKPPPPKCMVTLAPDGAASVQFYIDAVTFTRLQRKMGGQDPAMFLWENILHRAIEGAAY